MKIKHPLVSISILSSLLVSACPTPVTEEKDSGSDSGTIDFTPDATQPDAPVPDASLYDASPPDAASSDITLADADLPQDSSVQDSATADVWQQDVIADGARPDLHSADSSAGDSGSCAIENTICQGIGPSAASYTLVTSPAGLEGARSLQIGASLATVRSVMAGVTETIPSYNNFAIVYCSEGLVLSFADNLEDTAASEGVLSDSDTLYKITAYGDFNGATDSPTPLAIGDNTSTATTALGTPDYTGSAVSNSGSLGEFHFYYAGRSALFVDNAVVAISLFASQNPTNSLDASLDLAAGTIGAVSVDHDVIAIPIANGSTLAQVRSAFGQTPEAAGDTNVLVGSTSTEVVILSYSVLGVRLVGPTSQYGGFPPSPITGEDRKVFTAFVTAPFQGTDNGIGIGSTQAEVEARFGAPDSVETEDNVTLYKYNTGSRKTGIIYVTDSGCTPRIAVIIVNVVET